MKWSMDTHKYISEITRKALQIMVAHNITGESTPDEIEAVERELAEAHIYQDFESAKGRVRRALFTYFKAYGCLDENERLTEMGKLYADNKISIQEFSLHYIVNYRYTSDNSCYFPAQLILRCLKKLCDYDAAQAFLTPYDFSLIVECQRLSDINDELVARIIAAHNAVPVVVNERAIGYDVWVKMLVQSGLLQKREDRAIEISNWGLTDWILDSYTKQIEINQGILNTGIFRYIPILPLVEKEEDVTPYLNEGRALQAFLFDGIDDFIIDKYIYNGESGNSSIMRTALGITDGSKGFYSAFCGLERLVGYSLLKNESSYVKTIGGIIANTEVPTYEENDFDDAMRFTGGENIILYGVPGAGKSWTIKNEYCSDESCMERLVFHPDYTYSDFVGQIMPKVDEKGGVTYEFTPGPFTELVKKAYKNPNKMYYLVIEEINRGNAPAIFGDIFQLLDRQHPYIDGKENPKYGASEYAITNADIARVVYGDASHGVSIPSNMSILCTMNTSDQNVFTLDTAFQRRWSMRLISNEFGDAEGEQEFAATKILDTDVTWQKFFTEVNTLILNKNIRMTSSEDKRLGTHFVSQDDLRFDPYDGDDVELLKKANRQNRRFAEKVLKYLWDDAFKFNKDEIFDLSKVNSLEKVIKDFVSASGNERFKKIFKEGIANLLIPRE